MDLASHYNNIQNLLISDDLYPKLEESKSKILQMRDNGGRLILAGNGGSAGIVSHAAVDFTKQAQVAALTFNDASMITAFANDFGYENWVKNAFEMLSTPNDILVCVSVSGTSENLVNAVKAAKQAGNFTITFSGTSADNDLKALGDISFFVNSQAYNIVEGIHMIWLTSIVDMIIGKSVYKVS